MRDRDTDRMLTRMWEATMREQGDDLAEARYVGEADCHPPDDLDPTDPNLNREEWAETRTCQVCGIAGEDVSASRRCRSCEKYDIMPETRWDRAHPEYL